MPNRSANHYDVVVVGARCAGAATALLLARQGARVLVVDRSSHGADTVSTHALMPAGVLQLDRWGLLDRVVAAGTPAVRLNSFHLEAGTVPMPVGSAFGVDALYAPRRTVLDAILVDAAREAGAEVRYGVSVRDLARDDDGRVVGIHGTHGGAPFTASADVTVGADGMHSTVARRVGASITHAAGSTSACAYAYVHGADTDGYHWSFRPGVAAGMIPTNGGQTCVFVVAPPARLHRELTPDAEPGFHYLLGVAAPEFVDRLAGATPSPGLRRFPGLTGYLRKPFGPGWALVGDAGYYKDPLSAHGITDALRDAQLLAGALGSGTAGSGALAAYEAHRDRLSLPLFGIVDEIASFRWDAEEIGVHLLELSNAMNAELAAVAELDPVGADHGALAAAS